MSDKVAYTLTMRILGVLLIVFSILEFGVGGAVFNSLTNVQNGAWWAGLCTFFAGVCGFRSNSRLTVSIGCLLSILGTLGALVGAILDGVASATFIIEKTCMSTSSGTVYGDQESHFDIEYVCDYDLNSPSGNAQLRASADIDSASYFYNHQYQYYNYHNNHNENHYHTSFWGGKYSSGNDYDCICTYTEDHFHCYGYTLGSTLSNCGEILTKYKYMLPVSTVLTAILFLIGFVYSIYTCFSLNADISSSPSVVPGEGNVLSPMGYAQPVQYAPVEAPMQYAPLGAVQYQTAESDNKTNQQLSV